MATQPITLPEHQLVALVAAILMTRTVGKALSEDDAVKLAKRVTEVAYKETRTQS